MKYTAICRNEQGNLTRKVDDYFTNKAAFASELRANGFKVLKVLTDKQIEDIKKNPTIGYQEDYESYIHQVM